MGDKALLVLAKSHYDKMKFALVFLPLLVAAVYAVEDEKRFIFGDLQLNVEDLVPKQALQDLVKAMVNVVGSDATEKTLETACNSLISVYITSIGSHLVCPQLCTNFQHFVQKYGQ